MIKDYNSISSVKVRNINEIIERYNTGEEIAITVVDNYIKYLSAGIASIMFMFNPSDIIIGGEISKYSEILLEKLRESIFSDNDLYKEKDVNIMFSSLNGNSNILGAAYIPIIENLGL
jgi:predicted NBD/HSP70 family sugar kinase